MEIHLLTYLLTHHAVITYQLSDPIFCLLVFRCCKSTKFRDFCRVYNIPPTVYYVYLNTRIYMREKQLLTRFVHTPKKNRRSRLSSQGLIVYTVLYLFLFYAYYIHQDVIYLQDTNLTISVLHIIRKTWVKFALNYKLIENDQNSME